MATPESAVKEGVKKILKKHDIWYYMPVAGPYAVHGIPDFIACWKGHFLAIETKAPGKTHTVTVNQQRNIDAINQHGGWAIVIDDPEKLNLFLVTKILEGANAKINTP